MTSTAISRQTGDHAVVLGASMAGLLAARVLTETFQKVTVIDRDVIPEVGMHRRGVPHGRHAHGLQPRGKEILDELFPGFTADVVRAGAELGDFLGNCRWLLSGCRLCQADMGMPSLVLGRPLLEGHIHARVRALPNVTFMEDTDIVGLITTADQRQVTGVRVCSRDGTLVPVQSDLVVDATGRSSRTPIWLEELGYQRPAEDRIGIKLGYATRTYQLRPGALGKDMVIIIGGTPDIPRYGVISALGDGRHGVTLGGILGDYPPTDPAGFDTFAASLVFTDIADAILGAEPLDDPLPFRFPANVRRRYERLRQFPDGLLVIGDAVCSFNPLYGHGMTVAASQALALRRLMVRSLKLAPKRYFRMIAKTIDQPWDIAVGADLAFAGVAGTRTAKIRLVNAYVPRFHAAAAHDVSLAAAFLRVIGLLDRPEGLLRPDRPLRVWWTNRRHPAGPRLPAHQT